MSHDDNKLEITHRLSDGTKALVRQFLTAMGETNNRLDSLTGQIAQLDHKQDLILGLLEGEHGPISKLSRKVDTFMATQEERLQAILVAVKNVKEMLADLKINNPALEDEITSIENELAPAPEPEPTPEG